MAAMFILLVGMLGMFKAIDLVTQENIKNSMRDEAVQIAEDRIAAFRAVPFSSFSANRPYPVELVPSTLRGVSKNYSVFKTATQLGGSHTVQLDIKVRWAFKNWSTTHEVVSVRSN